ncbi:MAG: response regulator [Cytophagaceae bacterium]|nr:response regulator [Cytophagaceae bacterium]
MYSVFVADDDPDEDILWEEAVALHGQNRVHFRFFPDGNNLIEYLEGHPEDKPTLVITDLNMPISSGYVVLQHLKSDPALKSIPVIVVTGLQGIAVQEIDTIIALGAMAFEQKPASFDEYIRLLDTVIGLCENLDTSEVENSE